MEVLGGRRPSKPTTANETGIIQLDQLWSLIELCWQGPPEDRPEMSTVVNQLDIISPHMQLVTPNAPIQEPGRPQSRALLSWDKDDASLGPGPPSLHLSLYPPMVFPNPDALESTDESDQTHSAQPQWGKTEGTMLRRHGLSCLFCRRRKIKVFHFYLCLIILKAE
jgi:hypothetical protein